ncbi:dual specificity protein phosphatase family protein [Pseudomonas sp. fls2-241-R2A-110]|jgi:protein-tyrosine phosphatase|uniref:protein-tyrosine phosphatase family protein n=1 Tax=unclassified Pseudomonas TaxID=196821 RepID=UPI0025576094|nr:dual specificity protein phosphatase family protein [Pseudomonas sp. fls2-241-R2A-110]
MKIKVSTLPGYVAKLSHGKLVVYQNWVTFDKGTTKVFRSSQPYYNDKDDTLQKFDASAITLLKNYGIKGIISLNQKLLEGTSASELSKESITYHHLEVKDFNTPTAQELMQGCKAIDSALSKGNVLVYCGFGQGRTGTMMTAYEIYKLPKGSAASKLEAVIAASTAEIDDQEKSLRALYKLQNP